ncbi:MAG: DoxX family membrane protein [Nitrososphaerota archaeon]|nr:DoxX family membrane protein [Nitrososphaerota archaeon]MDG7023748.1 DoxX family membrane protein [Nitrososphaerota archaeon]
MSQAGRGDEQFTTWWSRNAHWLGVSLRVGFGTAWLIDGVMKFVWLAPSDVINLVQSSGQGQPSWLIPWYNFWTNLVSSNPAFALYGIGLWELVLGFALVFGLMRKLAYLSGILLSLLIYSIDEGFGGPYGPGSTDIGAAIIYLFVFFALIALESATASNSLTLDSIIERATSKWASVAEFTSPAMRAHFEAQRKAIGQRHGQSTDSSP